MDYRIEKKEAFWIVGYAKHFTMNVEENFAAVPQFWGETMQSGNFAKLFPLMAGEPQGILGVSACMNGEDFDYYIAVVSDKAPEAGMERFEVPARLPLHGADATGHPDAAKAHCVRVAADLRIRVRKCPRHRGLF